MSHKSWLIALATHGHWRHIGGICLEHDTTQGHGLCQRGGQFGLLEGEHTPDTEYETIEAEQLTRLELIARKTVEHATRQIVLIPF